jgi:hypothetical protein
MSIGDPDHPHMHVWGWLMESPVVGTAMAHDGIIIGCLAGLPYLRAYGCAYTGAAVNCTC